MPTLILQVAEYDDQDRWTWRLTSERGAPIAAHAVRLNTSAVEYEGYRDMAAALERHAPDGRLDDERRWLERFGDWLAAHAFGAIAGKLVEHAPVTVRVRVPAAAGALLFRPFEAARVNGKTLVRHGVTLVWEWEGAAASRLEEQDPADRLRMLAVFSLPAGGSPLNLRGERQALKRLVGRLTGGGAAAAIDLRVLQYGATRQVLTDALAEDDGWDVLHISGHGAPGCLVMEGAGGKHDLVTAEALIDLLRDNRHRLKLVVLSACDSAAATLRETMQDLNLLFDPKRDAAPTPGPTAPGPTTEALTQALARALGCAVIAMRYPVGDDFAIAFAGELYEAAFEKRRVLPNAVRDALIRAFGRGLGYPLAECTVSLFGATATTLKLQPPVTEAATVRTGLFGFPDEPPEFVGRVAEMTQASAVLASRTVPLNGSRALLFLGMAGGGKTACALELAHHLWPTGIFKHAVWFKAPDERDGYATALSAFAQALDDQFPGATLTDKVGDDTALNAYLPRLAERLRTTAVLIVIDNLEGLLTPDGTWWDDQWRRTMAALLGAGGLSRVVLTSRRQPADLPASVSVLPVYALSLSEAALLARRLPNLGRLIRQGGAEGRTLVRRLLRMVQGHPKLIELAEAQAADRDALTSQIAHAEAAWRDGGAALDAYFHHGASTLEADDFLRALSDWTHAAVERLPENSRLLFTLLTGMEEEDRIVGIVGQVWPNFWKRTEHQGEAPDIDATLTLLLTAALVDKVGADERTSLRLHPGVAEAARAASDPAFGDAVAREIAAFWMVALRLGLENDAAGGGPLIVRAGLSVVPYLLRLGEDQLAAFALEQVVQYDRTPATLAAALSGFAHLADRANDDDGRMQLDALIGSVLQLFDRREEAERRLRSALDAAKARGNHRMLVSIAGALINLFRAAGRLEEALAISEEQARGMEMAGLGPWTRLGGDVAQLQILIDLDRSTEILDAVERRLPEVETLSIKSDANEALNPWNVLETFFGIGLSAALRLERWEATLAFNERIVKSKVERGAGELERARARINDHGPLIRLERFVEAHTLLRDILEAGRRFGDVELQEKALSGLANLENAQTRPDHAVGHQTQALRLAYGRVDPLSVTIGHQNLSNYLMAANRPPADALAHGLAAAFLFLVMGRAHDVQDTAGNLLIQLRRLGAEAPRHLPANFADLCERLAQWEGAERFPALFDALAVGRFSGDDLLKSHIKAALAALAKAAAQAE